MKTLYTLLASSLIMSAAGAAVSPTNSGPTATAASTVVSVNAANISYTIPFSSVPTWTRVYIDANQTAASGYAMNGTGADYLVENGMLYRYSGTNGSWSWTKVKQLPFALGATSATLTVAKTDIGSPASIDSISETTAPTVTSARITTSTSTTAPPSTSSSASVESLNIKYVIPFSTKPTWTRVYIDADRTLSSGYPNSGIGAEYLIENGQLFRYTGKNGDWGWTVMKALPFNIGTTSATVSVAIADLGAPPSIDSVTQTYSPTKISPKFTTNTVTTTPPTPVTPPPPVTATVWIDYFGDSTAHGDIGNTPYQVARQPSVVMDENLPSNYHVRNEAVGGASIAELLAGTDGVHAPWTTTVARSNAKYIVMNYAINDSYEPGTTPASYKASYAKVIDIARAAGKTVILQTSNPTLNNQKDVTFSTAMKEVATEKNVPVIDVFAYLSQYMAANHLGPYQITNDGIHPNQATYILVGEYTAKRFKEIVGIK